MSDTKHGWVSPRADGARARCGGPGICATCNTEAMHEKMLTGLFGAPAATPHRAPAEREAVDTDSFDDPSALAAAADALSGDTSNDNAQFAAAYLYRQAKALATSAAPPCPTCNDQGAVGNILTAQPCPDCAAPASPVSTVEDAGAQKVVIDFDQVGSAGPFHVIDGRVTIPAVTVMDLVRMASPAAGDAQGLTLAQKYEDACILANANARDAARWRAYAAQFPEISDAFLAVHAVDGGNPLPTIKGAAITGGYVVVTPAGWDADKATKLRDAILRLFHVNPAHTPRPSDELAAQRKGDA
ncbi:hypothetical protein SB816_28240 [Achromobacter sp. SIMBA_011]|uniref:hypothetical protein n=1 Tax=Achromobacter sp. SIMBA_011 TaxID=3085759 RepID=UPI00397BB509